MEPIVKVKAPEGTTTAVHAGQEYHVKEDGLFEMPQSHALALKPFGFTILGSEAEKEDASEWDKFSSQTSAPGIDNSTTAGPIAIEILDTGLGNAIPNPAPAAESPASGLDSEGNSADAAATETAPENDNVAPEGEGSAPAAGESTEPSSTTEQVDGVQAAVETLEGEGGIPAPEAPEVNQGGDGTSDTNAAA